MAEKRRKPPKGGWWKGKRENMPGRYVVEVYVADPSLLPPMFGHDPKAPKKCVGSVSFQCDLDRVEKPQEDVVWSYRRKMGPGAETRCRNEAEKAAAIYRAYYERTGVRWDVLYQASYFSRNRLPIFPPSG